MAASGFEGMVQFRANGRVAQGWLAVPDGGRGLGVVVIQERLRAAGGTVESHVYDAGRAFFNDARPEAFVRTEAALAWSRTLEFRRTRIT